MKKGTVEIIFGSVLIFLQILSYIGNAKAGVTIELESVYDLIFLFSYSFIGIIGIVFFILGLISINKSKEH